MNLADRINKRMEALGITQAELSRRSGLSRPYVNQLVRGQNSNPTAIMIAKLAKALETNLYVLMGEDFEQTCESCVYYEESNYEHSINKPKFGVCHRYPPIFESNNYKSLGLGFSVVRCNTWCGEWTPKEITNETV